MSVHIGKICSKAFHGLYKIQQIRESLSPETTKTLVHAFDSSHLDHCNSLLFGVPNYQSDRLQKVLNAAARLFVDLSKFDHISSAFHDLHGLPVIYRGRFKLLLLVYKALNNQAPDYIKDFLHIKTNTTYRLRSQDHNLLAIPRTKHRTFGDRALAHFWTFFWNKPPREIRLNPTLAVFKSKLKTYFFKKISV